MSITEKKNSEKQGSPFVWFLKFSFFIVTAREIKMYSYFQIFRFHDNVSKQEILNSFSLAES